jgi:hypothetical protein
MLPTANRVLLALSADDRSLIGSHLERSDLPLRMRLAQPGRKIPYVYFLDSGMASIVVKGPKDSLAEVAVVGFEGIVSCSVLLGVDRTPEDVFMQIPG